MKEYTFPESAKKIAGHTPFDENICRNMVIAGMEWFDQNEGAMPIFKKYEDIRGILFSKNGYADSLTMHIMCLTENNEWGMHEIAIKNIERARSIGWDKYISELC